MKKSLLPLLLFAFCSALGQKFQGLASTPPMGWNSWNTFQTKISEKLVMDIADKMISSGMAAAGYDYIVLDDGWMTMKRDSGGNLVPDPEKFPHGLRALVDYIHSKGLKFGLYNCAGTKTCAGYPGTRGYEYQDARFYASMDIDYLKFDWCYAEGINAKEAYGTMSKALHQAGRPILFSLCEWGTNKPWEWAKDIGQMWRTTGDIYQIFDSTKDFGTWKANGVMRILDLQKGLREYAGPGHWNDPDMMEVGNGMSLSEDRAHFSMWCMIAAPLIAGNDLRKMTKESGEILTNTAAILVDQDSLGVEGFQYAVRNGVEIWCKPLAHGDWAICFLNRTSETRQLEFDWKKEMVRDGFSSRQLDGAAKVYSITDLWTKKKEGNTTKAYNVRVPAHDVSLLRLNNDSN
jgi:alpha-galactosidase